LLIIIYIGQILLHITVRQILNNLFIGIALRELAKRHYRKDELVVRIRDQDAVIEHPFHRFLRPFAVRQLAVHDQLDALTQRLYLWIFSLKQADDGKGRLYNLATAGVLDVFKLLAALCSGN
jgi:hypothetical protein